MPWGLPNGEAFQTIRPPASTGEGDLFDDEMYESFSSQKPYGSILMFGHSRVTLAKQPLLLDLADSAVTFERDKNINIDYREIGSIPLVVLCSNDNQTIPRSTIRPDQLSDSLIAMPINLSVCLRSFLRRSSFDITTLPLRNTGYGHRGPARLHPQRRPRSCIRQCSAGQRTECENRPALTSYKLQESLCFSVTREVNGLSCIKPTYWFLFKELQKMME